MKKIFPISIVSLNAYSQNNQKAGLYYSSYPDYSLSSASRHHQQNRMYDSRLSNTGYGYGPHGDGNRNCIVRI